MIPGGLWRRQDRRAALMFQTLLGFNMAAPEFNILVPDFALYLVRATRIAEL
jgi:hypothetical protein